MCLQTFTENVVLLWIGQLIPPQKMQPACFKPHPQNQPTSRLSSALRIDFFKEIIVIDIYLAQTSLVRCYKFKEIDEDLTLCMAVIINQTSSLISRRDVNLNLLIFSSKFDPHQVSHIYDLVPLKKINKMHSHLQGGTTNLLMS